MIETTTETMCSVEKRQRVLVVDDEPEVLRTVADILGQADYDVICLPSVAAAQACLERETFHLVLSDLYLGDSGLGYQIADAARACRPSVPVILLTGRPTFNGAKEALRSHVYEIVVKPVDPLELVNSCRRTIQAAHSERRQRRLEAQNRVLASVLPRAIEAKDPTTSGHAERVVHYTDTLAQRCGVPDEERARLRLASLLHDVGKIGIPEGILTKQGPLTQAERKVVETHPEVGRQILAPLEHSDDVRTWVYQHHERWDGRGYPNGLRGDEVSLPGRILILAEVFDALAEARSYKPAWPTGKIVGFFRQQAGSHFDPDLAHMVADGLEQHGNRFFASEPDMLF
jgi:putative two-component system response regulator